MNEQKPPVVLNNLTEEKNNDELIVIKEDYISSPKCGIKCKIVKKVIKNIIFTPVEISAQPYFKYSVTQIKEEQKNDISQSETDNTKLLEDKSKTYNLSTKSNNDDLKSSQQDTKIEKSEKIEQTNDISDTGNTKEEKENEYNYIHIVEKKESEKTLNLSYKFNESAEKENKIGNKAKKYLHKGSSKINVKLNLHNIEEKEKEKEKEKDREKEKEKGKKKRKFRNSQNVYNYLNNIAKSYNIHSEKEHNGSLLKISQNKENKEKDNKKNAAIVNFYSNLKKDKNYSPKQIAKDKKDIMKLASSFTSTNIKRYKKSRKNQENDSKKKTYTRQCSYIPAPKIKKNKVVFNNEKEKDKKTRRRTLIPKEEIKKENKKIYNNILNEDKDNNKIKILKLRSKNIKMKSLGEHNSNKDEILNLEPYNKKTEKDKCWTPKRKLNYNLKKEDNIKETEDNASNKYCCSISNSLKNRNMLKAVKGKRRVSFFNNTNNSSYNNSNENKKKKRIYTEEKKEGAVLRKRKSIFSILKDREKEKNKDKDSVKERDKSSIREKKADKKSKKRKNKEKKSRKEKDNLNSNPKIIRKDKSFTLGSKMNKKLMNDVNQNIKQVKTDSKFNDISNSYDSPNSSLNNSEISRSKTKGDNEALNLSNGNYQSDNPDVRRNSTRNMLRNNVPKEKIIALTNKQTIDNINDYTKKCLRIIPDLYELGEKMPRCKTKIHPNLSGKKLALFDLDETIVHCIGEINMNNVESFTKQCDAKIKVRLPGGKREITIGINIRPHWEEALKRIQNKYHIIAFTASHESYADSVLNHLDPEGKYFEFRLYRCHCVLCIVNGMKFYVKDLKIVEDLYSLKDVVIIDNSVLSFAYHLDNGIPISPFYDSKNDNELLEIADFLVKYANENDIRDKLKEVYKLSQYMEILKEYNSEEDEESSNNLENEEENDEKNNLSSDNKNRTNINLIKPLLVNNINININKENTDDKADKSKDKNISQINLKLKNITNMFDDENKDKASKSHFNALKKSKKSFCKYLEPSDNNINGNKRKEKNKTILLGINFQKEWEEKQRELKNN